MDLLSAMIADSKKVADPIAASYASGNRPFTVTLTRPGVASSYDRDTHAVLNPPDPVLYTGPARIYSITGGTDIDIGDERTTLSSARITIDSYDGPIPRVDDVITVIDTTQAQNTHVVGRQFAVTDVEIGGHFGIGYLLTTIGVAPSSRT